MRNLKPVNLAITAALCYGISAPLSKLLLSSMSPTLMASLLYLGAGSGMLVFSLARKKSIEAKITKAELPYTAAMIVLDIAAPILLMLGLKQTNSATASLLNNFEIVATTLIALIFFKEAVGRRTWSAISLITAASFILSVEDFSDFTFSYGAVFVLLACLCWGVENNCTRMLSLKDPVQIVIVKGFGSGFGALGIAVVSGQASSGILLISAALLLGFVAYGLSIYFYILAQRELGAARTSAYYAFAPFIGVGLSFIIFLETPSPSFIVALVVMITGAYMAAYENHEHAHLHTAQEHEHKHRHDDGHHDHWHEFDCEEHSHAHKHAELSHAHRHTPDMHHTHVHDLRD